MSAPLPKMGFIGDPAGPLAQQLKADIDLLPLAGAPASLATGVDAVIIDGQAGGAQAAAGDAATLRAVLEAGKTMALAQPSAAQLQALSGLTGAVPNGGIEAVVYTRLPGGSGPARYDCVIVPIMQSSGQIISVPGGVAQPVPPGQTPPLGARLEQAIRQSRAALNGGSDSPAADEGDGQELVAPPGAIYGTSGFSSSLITWPVQVTFDRNAGSNTQTATGQAYNNFYVYYVNGEGGAPYYIVILRQTGSFSPGAMLANSTDSRGFFQVGVEVTAAVNQTSGQPFSSGVTVLWHSPSAFGSSAQVPVYIQGVTMTLMADSNGGSAPTTFTPVEQANIYLLDWGCQDKISGNSPDWNFHQVSVWDPTQDLVSNWSQWRSSVYGSGNSVDAMPPLSESAFTFETLTIWRFDGSLINASGANGRGLPVAFSGAWVQSVAFIDNSNGSNNNAENLGGLGNSTGWGWSIDLGYTALQTP
jgi:hypothetical protein